MTLITSNSQFLVLSNIHSEHLVKSPTRTGNNKPEERQHFIYEHLKSRNFLIYNCHNAEDQIISEDDLTKVHAPHYVTFLKNVWKSWEQSGKDVDYTLDEGIVPYHFTRKPFAMIKQLPYWKQMGYFASDMATPINESTYPLVIESANNGIVAADVMFNAKKLAGNFEAVEAQAEPSDEHFKSICKSSHNLIYCLNTVPGHHAHLEQYGGYCFINNAAVCAMRLLSVHKVKKVAILDLDYHCHDGTQEIFYNNEHVLTVSIHADPHFDYPSFYGHEIENTPTNRNFTFPKMATWEEYKPILLEALSLIKDFNTEVLILAFGADTVEQDPDPSKLYGCSLSVDSYGEMGEEIGKVCSKIIVTQEGGYELAKVPWIIENLLHGIVTSVNKQQAVKL